MAKNQGFSRSQLNSHLAQIGQEVESIDDEGRAITKEEAIARLIYKKALGWNEQKIQVDEYGNRATYEEYHPPENWAIQYLYDRREGKVPQAAEDASKKRSMTASESVRELAQKKINSLAKKSEKNG